MRYIITQEQIDQILVMLSEVPAKHSFNSIIILKQLPKLDEPADKPKAADKEKRKEDKSA